MAHRERRKLHAPGAEELVDGPFGPGAPMTSDEKSHRYLRFLSASWNLNKVLGFRMTASLGNRLAGTNSDPRPKTKRSNEFRFGARRRARLLCGHSERIDVAIQCRGDAAAAAPQISSNDFGSFPNATGQKLQGTHVKMVTVSMSRPRATTTLSAIRTTKGPANPLQPSVHEAMLAAVPRLRAFAVSLSGKVDLADDLVQETLLRAIANINSFQPGTNMSAWLFTILRNHFLSEYRKRRREIADADGRYIHSLKSPPEQHSRVEFEEFRMVLAKLPSDQREALLLVGASGFSYKEAAAICETPIGTIKSRVNRARTRLSELLVIDSAEKFGPDHTTLAILTAGVSA
jgi:RNA polymerase sigma-70 factor, ECF subfamily